MDLPTQVRRMMARVRHGRLPSSERVVQMAFEELGYGAAGPAARIVRQEFNLRLHQVFTHTLSVLERYEEQAYAKGLPDELIAHSPDAFKKAGEAIKEASSAEAGLRTAFHTLFEDLYPVLRRVFQSISQSRMTRGGKDFELQIGRLLEYCGIPYQKVERQTRTDFMVPSDAAFNENPTIALVLSAKRTLRERWREVAEELFNLRSPNVYLLTADDRITDGHVSQICGQYRIHLVVWDEIKDELFANLPLVLGYSELAMSVFPTFEARW